MLGLVLFFVGAVLCLNGLWLLGRIGDNEISIINYLVGGITLLACLFLAFGPGADSGSIKAAAAGSPAARKHHARMPAAREAGARVERVR